MNTVSQNYENSEKKDEFGLIQNCFTNWISGHEILKYAVIPMFQDL